MKLYNTRTRQIEPLVPIHNTVRIYSCGPTVYDHIHIGNLSAFTYADMLRRALSAMDQSVRHVMNFTDVDDKTIARSKEEFPNLDPLLALKSLTEKYGRLFIEDMQSLGNDIESLEFVKATDSIEGMRQLIKELYEEGYAYVAEDGIYFSIESYRAQGKKYGQLSEITESNTSNARIDNDEYDKEHVHDFALWKKHKPGEPVWEFELAGHDLSGRPGWHIECSVMSVQKLGQPFDIHTGGIDLIFPHHENEIAQSTALNGEIYATIFFHNEHLLVDGKKMSKSLNNFYTLKDVEAKGYDALDFRILILQSHYRNQTQFSWDNLTAASNRLKGYRAMADLKWQLVDKPSEAVQYQTWIDDITQPLMQDLNTPESLSALSKVQDKIISSLVSKFDKDVFEHFLRQIDIILGLNVANQVDITEKQKQIIENRQLARDTKDWQTADSLRDQLHEQGIAIRDTDYGQIWSRL